MAEIAHIKTDRSNSRYNTWATGIVKILKIYEGIQFDTPFDARMPYPNGQCHVTASTFEMHLSWLRWFTRHRASTHQTIEAPKTWDVQVWQLLATAVGLMNFRVDYLLFCLTTLRRKIAVADVCSPRGCLWSLLSHVCCWCYRCLSRWSATKPLCAAIYKKKQSDRNSNSGSQCQFYNNDRPLMILRRLRERRVCVWEWGHNKGDNYYLFIEIVWQPRRTKGTTSTSFFGDNCTKRSNRATRLLDAHSKRNQHIQSNSMNHKFLVDAQR